MLNCASLCCILIHKFQCMYALSTYLPNFGCHFLPLWKIFQFTWTALCAAARINFVRNLLFSLFIFPFLFSFFREFCACCPVCMGEENYPKLLPWSWRGPTSITSRIVSRMLHVTIRSRWSWGQDQCFQGCHFSFKAINLHVSLYQWPLGCCCLNVSLLNHPVRFFKQRGCEVLEFRCHLE